MSETAKVILLCGKICCGKSYYVRQLSKQAAFVLLSCDEMMFDFAKNGFSEDFDVLVQKVKAYFYRKAVEIVSCGADVVLDFGFWGREERQQVSRYFTEQKIAYEWRYIDVSDEDWKQNIDERNKLVFEKKCDAYPMDAGLVEKLESQFEQPTKEEMDLWVTNIRGDTN